jgi:hypothetical protein
MATSLDLSRTYTSYSGVDIRVIINGQQAGSMQALSYAIQREKAPIYVMGSVDPISYSRGKRGIAGTMISLMLDTHILMSPVFTGEKYLGDKDEVFAQVGNKQNRATDTKGLADVNNETDTAVALVNVGGAQFGSTLKNNEGKIGEAGATASGPYQRLQVGAAYNVTDVGNNYAIAPVFYVDQILPFDITILAVNEYGQSAQMRLYGCEILNEGSGFSIDDIVIENQMTYVCRTILPWRTFDMQIGGSSAREELYKWNNGVKNRNGSGLTSDSGYAEVQQAEVATQPSSTQQTVRPGVAGIIDATSNVIDGAVEWARQRI